jgi:hypothetical protein
MERQPAYVAGKFRASIRVFSEGNKAKLVASGDVETSSLGAFGE